MPILTISEIVNNEISQMQFRFGGTPADVVEYSDGGRKASGQALTVEGLEAVTGAWVVQEPSVVPTADANGMVPEFFGPRGIIALKVDFGFGEVILRADAATLHKELRDILLDRLSQLQVDNDSFRTAVTTELDAMRVQIDTTVSDALADVQTLIDTSLGAQIDQAVDDKLATDLAPTLTAAVNDALANDIPPLITAEVATQVPPVVTAQVASLQTAIDGNAVDIANNAITIANNRYELDSTKNRVTSAEGRIQALEVWTLLSSFSKTVTFSDCVCTLKLTKFQNIVFGELYLKARTNNGGAIAYVDRPGMGVPSVFIPKEPAAANTNAHQASNAAGQQFGELFQVGIDLEGDIVTRAPKAWNELRGKLLYFV